MKYRSESDRIRDALYKSLIVAGFSVFMLVVEKETVLGLIGLGVAGLIFVLQYLIPLRRQPAEDRDLSDSER